ncbi:MAG: hypothetical protein KKD44_18430 [Proteobacteria bacterium]|nr:hypothetical protein [Pseudomonadota bacterium]
MKKRQFVFGFLVLSILLSFSYQAFCSTLDVFEVPPGSGLYGYPYGAVPTQSYFPGSPVLDLDAFGYIEKEFFMSGTANTYRQKGLWLNNGKWGVSVRKANVPYTTRLIVRYPEDPNQFNGTVVVEWLNESTGTEVSPDWSDSYTYFLRKGYAYIGVTAMNGQAGVPFLKDWDSDRYSSLMLPTDGLSYDIFTQVSEAINQFSSEILGSLRPTKILAGGDSQSAMRLSTYVNAFQPQTKAYDGFLLRGRSSLTAPLKDGILRPYPIAFIRRDNTTPVIQVIAEGDLVELAFIMARQADTAYLRTWEIAGAAHIDVYGAAYELALTTRDLPSLGKMECINGRLDPYTGSHLVSTLPYFRIEHAAWDSLNNWVSNGIPPAKGNPIKTNFYGVIKRDKYGNALGGVRLPELDVPISTYYYYNVGANFMSSFVCLLGGYDELFDEATLAALYPTHADYVTDYTAAAQKLLKAGFLLEEDYDDAVTQAQYAPIP